MSRYFTKDHEWIDVEGDDGPMSGTIGITDYAQGQLGDITFVELPVVGQAVERGGAVGGSKRKVAHHLLRVITAGLHSPAANAS